MNYQGPGHYRHFKGGLYAVLGLGLKEDTVNKPGQDDQHGVEPEVVCVVYQPLTLGSLLEDRPEDFWLRELEDFNRLVEYEGIAQPRFVKLDPPQPEEG